MLNRTFSRKGQIRVYDPADSPSGTTYNSPFIVKKRSSKKKFPGLIMVLAVVAFLVLAVVGVLIFYLQKSPEMRSSNSTVSSSPVTSEPVSLTLNLSSPDDNLLVFDDNLLIQGKTSSKASVILSMDEEDSVTEPSPSGDFSATIKLRPGVNLLTVAVFDNNGASKSEERTVYYSEEKI
jgi:hypothetical protein